LEPGTVLLIGEEAGQVAAAVAAAAASAVKVGEAGLQRSWHLCAVQDRQNGEKEVLEDRSLG
jgi:hypothetical protein